MTTVLNRVVVATSGSPWLDRDDEDLAEVLAARGWIVEHATTKAIERGRVTVDDAHARRRWRPVGWWQQPQTRASSHTADAMPTVRHGLVP